ncbi:hypothetical protein [Mesorhizobium sp. WSM4313]|uniref:hypothetical protein n=1 Tax=Mesorhizobium sp. WSM4313 TaxID=2029412 RepID=UPI000BAFC590|nr:hypothetical protein [Mesorhizobium sp. WSM4313]PBB21136.1 hypothetical protein CK219_00410 [Mesorhizobium sp. WSM4313]
MSKGVKPVKAIVADQRAADLAKIDAEIERLEKLVAQKKSTFDADQRQHALDQDVDRQQRLKGEIGDINELLGKQRERRFKTELGEVEPPKAAPTAKQHRPWNIDEKVLKAGKPAYPGILRGSQADNGIFSEAYFATKLFWEATVADHFRKGDLPADAVVNLDLAASIQGEVVANFYWYSERCAAIEARLDQLEQQTAELEKSGIRYGGIHQRANSYKRGTIVTYGGSGWIALKDADVGVTPGESPDIWQLAIKAGKDGRDRT